MSNKLRECFDEMVVYKDLQKTNFFSSLSLPSFLRDWILKKFEDDEGNYSTEEISDFIRTYYPRKEEWVSIKDRLITDNEHVKILAKISVDVDIRTSEKSFALPEFGLSSRETYIDENVWEECKEDLLKAREQWGVVEMGYRYPDENGPGKIKLVSFSNFCPYEVDLDFYKDIRKEFTIDEWIDVLLGAIDYNPKGYENHLQKMTMLTRLLPFVEKRLNLIELAPKGTGKSYLFGRVSKYSWLSTGGTMTRAKMFYDVSKRAEGLVCNNDYVALDEIQTIDFGNVSEMQGAMKGYMEQGEFTVGTYKGVGDAGIILLGNILQDYMDECGFMLKELPDLFKESALMDRFHGFIKGWDIPRMHDGLKISDWALNSEYFCSIMHLLRNDGTYRAIVDELIDVPERADVRDTEAVKRIATAYLKLLFPNVRNKKDVDLGMFNHYCLKPAKSMRQIIRNQLGHLDPKEYGGKDVPQFKIKAENAN